MDSNADLVALTQLTDQLAAKEQELATAEQALAERDQQFANYIKAQKRNKTELEVLRGMIKEKMEEMGISEHTTSAVRLTLRPSGKFTTDDVDAAPDEVCVVKRTLDNKKCKAYLDLNGTLPEGVKPTAKVLTIKPLVKEEDKK